MTKPRSKTAAPHPADLLSPGQKARMKRRLFNMLLMRDPPEVREAYLRQREAERAAAKARRETP